MRYPIGIQDFGKLREMGFVYVDKTKYIRMLLETPNYYFLSRPRRFGKSLFISTLQAYFEGRRELFKGLDIDTDDMDWTPRPVIKFSLNTVDPKSEHSLYESLNNTLRFYEKIYGYEPDVNAPAERFQNLIVNAFRQMGKKVVILVDEYDAPLLNTLENESLNNSYRDTLRAVFSVIKNADAYIEFAFVTGVSRFSHTSLFSGANNLEDISLYDKYSAICGLTEEEIKDVFMPGIHYLADRQNKTDEEMLALLKDNYDGYHFSQNSPDIYNPFSFLHALKSERIDDYWFASGTPTYLISALKRDNFYLPELDCIETTEGDLSSIESYMQNPVTLLYESGYVTIKDYDDEIQSYILALPNKEVSTSFSRALLSIYSGKDLMECRDSFNRIRKALLKGEPDNFMRHIQTFFQGNPYALSELDKRERYFQNNIYLIFKALGFEPRVEEQTCNSRMDLMLRTPRYVYIFELKTNGSVDKAMRQIEEKGYALPYLYEGKTIIKIAANYSTAANNIESWKISIMENPDNARL